MQSKNFLDYKNADWTKLRTDLNDNLTINNNLETCDENDFSVTQLTQLINNAIDYAVSRREQRYMATRLPLSQEIKNLITERNKIRKMYQRTKLDYLRKTKNNLSNTIKTRIKIFYNEN